jgi:hypothetical protein
MPVREYQWRKKTPPATREKEEPMSALFGDDEDNATEKLLRAGRAGDRTIFTAPATRAGGTDQVRRVLFHPPRGHDPGKDPETPNQIVRDNFPKRYEMTIGTPAETVDDRFPDPWEMMRSIDAYELGVEKLKREFERSKREREDRGERLHRNGIREARRRS